MEAGGTSNISEEASSDGSLYYEVNDPKKLSKTGQDEFEKAKNLVSTVGPKSKLSLYDHLRDILHQVIRHNIEDAVDQLEDISRSLKDKLDEEQTEERTTFDEDLKKFLEDQAKFYGLPKSAAENDDNNKESSHHSPELPDLPYIVGRFAQCGMGCLSPDESHDLRVALKNLASERKLKKIRFWGRVFTLAGEYIVAESPYQKGMELDEPAEKSPESEKDGVGANEYVYFVCTQIGRPWKCLPSLKPHHIIQARKIKRFFTGNLENEVGGNINFKGKEAHYLRAQIARISASTCIAPVDYYTQTGLGEDKKIILNEGFNAKPASAWEAYNAELEFWVHSRRALLENGRCTPVRAESKADLTEEVQEDAVPLFRCLTYDQVVDDLDLWNFKLSSKLSRENSVMLVQSSMWPGACTFYDGKSFEHTYIGYGYKEEGYERKKTEGKVPEVLSKVDEKQKDESIEEEYLDESEDAKEKEQFSSELEMKDHKVDTQRKAVDEGKESDGKMFPDVYQESSKKGDEKLDEIPSGDKESKKGELIDVEISKETDSEEEKVPGFKIKDGAVDEVQKVLFISESQKQDKVRKEPESSEEDLQQRSGQKVSQGVIRKESEDKVKAKQSSEVLDEGMTVKQVIQEGKDVIRKKSKDEVEKKQSSEDILREENKSVEKATPEEKEPVRKKSKDKVEEKESSEEVFQQRSEQKVLQGEKEFISKAEVSPKESREVLDEGMKVKQVIQEGKDVIRKKSEGELEKHQSGKEILQEENKSVEKVPTQEEKELVRKKSKDKVEEKESHKELLAEAKKSEEKVTQEEKELIKKKSKDDAVKVEENKSTKEAINKELVQKVIQEGKEAMRQKSAHKEAARKDKQDKDVSKEDLVEEKLTEKDNLDQLGTVKQEVSKGSLEGKIIEEGNVSEEDGLDHKSSVKDEEKVSGAEVLEEGKQKVLQGGKEAAEERSTETTKDKLSDQDTIKKGASPEVNNEEAETTQKKNIEGNADVINEGQELQFALSKEKLDRRGTEKDESKEAFKIESKEEKDKIESNKEKEDLLRTIKEEETSKEIITDGTKSVRELIQEALLKKSKEEQEAFKKESIDQEEKGESQEGNDKIESNKDILDEKSPIKQEKVSKEIITDPTKSIRTLIQEAVEKKSKEERETVKREDTDQSTIQKESQGRKQEAETINKVEKEKLEQPNVVKEEGGGGK